VAPPLNGGLTLRWIPNTDWAGLLAAIVIGSFVLAFVSPNFLSEFNIYVLLRSVCVGILVAFAQMLTLAVGQMNLAVGALGGMVAILFGGMMEMFGVPLWLAVPLAVAIGVAAGFVNGLLAAHTGINGFIVTLATGSAFTGVNLGLTNSVPFYKMPHALQDFGNGRFGAFPFLLIAPIVISPLLALFLFRLPVGRRLLAVGGNSEAAALSGASPTNAIVLAHCLSGLLAAIGAVLAVAQLGSAQPLIGSDWLLLSFAAPIIGGTALAGGYVSIFGAILAVLVIALIQNGLVLVNADPYWVQFLLGALIVAAIALNHWRARPIRLGW
jgi:ribose transport system permease protein